MRKLNFLFAAGLLLLGATGAKAEIGEAFDRSAWTVKASSWCWDDNGKTEGHFNQIKDGVTNFWHSNWRGGTDSNWSEGAVSTNLSSAPEYFIVDLGGVKNIGGFGYKARAESQYSNGHVSSYKIYVSEADFTLVTPATEVQKGEALSLGETNLAASGTLEENWGALQTIPTTGNSEVRGRYVLFVATGSYNKYGNIPYATCDEFYVYGYASPLKGNLASKIQELRDKVDAEGEGGFVGNKAPEVIAAARQAIEDAQSVYDNGSASDEEVNNAIATLETAITNFENGALIAIETGKAYMFINGKSGWNKSKSMYSGASDNELYWGNKDLTKNKHYWVLETKDNGYKIKSGDGTYIGGNDVTANGTGSDLFYMTSNESEILKFTFAYLGQTQWNILKNGVGAAHPQNQADGYASSKIIIWAGTDPGGASAWYLVPIASDHTVYNVNVVNSNAAINAPEGVEVAYSNGDKAINGGFFVVPTSDANPAFTVADIEGYTTAISVSGNIITVTCTGQLDILKATLRTQVDGATPVLAKTGIGYPAESSATRTALATAIANAETAYENATTEDAVNEAASALTTALENFKRSGDVLMPEEGRAYKITNTQKDGTTMQLYYTDADGLTIGEHNTAITGAEAAFICKKVTVGSEERYVFVFATAGKYMNYKGNGDGSQKGISDTYHADVQAFKLATNNSNNYSYDQYEALGGTFRLVVDQRATGGVSETKSTLVIKKTEKQFDGYSDAHAVADNYSNYFRIEEIPDFRNKITFNQLPEATDYYVATYSAPYATVVPEDVTAYAITTHEGDVVGTERLSDEGAAIPANTGVLLAARTAIDPQHLAPATEEDLKTVPNGNMLVGTGTGTTVDTDTNAYILADGSHGIGFYKLDSDERTIGSYRAYLELSTDAGSRLTINFGDIETGIDNINGTENTNGSAVMYDLSGRRVQKPVKGSMYIKNGVKYIHQ